MAITRYRTGITILTEDVANSWFGGLYGTSDGDALDPLDPLVAGHIHDGQHLNGHAQKIDLGDHVTGRLDGENLLDNSVSPSKLTSFSFDSVWSNESNIISNAPGSLALDDLVFGSDTLNDTGEPTHDNRLFFDKSSGAFRAGIATGTQWDTRGNGSAAFGLNNEALGDYSLISGRSNMISSNSNHSTIVGGISNNIVNVGSQEAIISGSSNAISATGDGNIIVGGDSNAISGASTSSVIIDGNNNSIADCSGSVILGGVNNAILTGANAAIVMGNKASAMMPGQFAIGGGEFPGGTGTPGSIQLSMLCVFGSWGATDTDILLTLDGSTPSASNILYVPIHTSALIKVEWIIRGEQSASPFWGGGIAYSTVGRNAAASIATDSMELESSTYNSGTLTVLNDRTVMTSSGSGIVSTGNLISLEPVGVDGGFYVNINLDGDLFGAAADGAGRAVATITITQVRHVF